MPPCDDESDDSLGGRHVVTTEDWSHWVAEYHIWLRERNVVGEVVKRLAHGSSNIRLAVMNGIPLPVTATDMRIVRPIATPWHAHRIGGMDVLLSR